MEGLSEWGFMWIKLLFCILLFPLPVFALDAPTVTATAKSYNQINLTWAAVSNPGYGYKVEIQSDGDSRYSTWTDYTALLKNGFGYLPYWVTEGHYLDRADSTGTTSGACLDHSATCGSHAQFMVFGLKYSTAYNFRVRSYGKDDNGSPGYSSYSSTASATTATPSTIRHVKAGVAGGNGTSEAQAWDNISDANGVSAGTLVIIHTGTYSGDSINTSNSGEQASRIVYQVDPGETATVTASNTILTLDTDYVTVDGFTMTDASGTASEVILMEGNRNIIANTTLDGPSPSNDGYGPYIMGNNNVFENNYWKEYGAMDGTGGSIIAIFGDYNIVSNCHHEKGGHDTAIVRGDRNMLVNTLFDGGWGIGIELQGTGAYEAQYNLVEGSILASSAMAGSPYVAEYKPVLEISADHNTVRRNIIRSGRDHGVEISSVNQVSNYNLVYNNVIYDNTQGGIWYMNGSNQSNVIANNIIYANAESFSYNCGYDTVCLRNTRTGATFHHNQLLWKSGATENTTRATILDTDASTCRTLAQWEAAEPTIAYNNVTTTPSFIDEGNFDFHLKSTSGLIAGGTSITDSYWGTTGEDDIGSFLYFASTASVPTATGCTLSGASLY
jgi:hypothetical protein